MGTGAAEDVAEMSVLLDIAPVISPRECRR
jgi:hypothetical protein